MNPKTNEMIAGRLAEQIEQQWSPFDRPGLPMPVNPTTGKAYRGMNALWLAMQDRNDPRWMTLKQASNKNGWKIATGSKGTLISFLKTTDRVQLLDENGRPQLNSRNNPKTELIKLTNPVETQAYVFNAEQIEDIPSLDDYQADREAANRLTPAEQLAKLVEQSKARVESTIGHPGYDPAERVIFMPEPDTFGTPQEHMAALLYELVKFAGHDKELYDPLDLSAAEEARPALAALFLGSQIGVQSQLAPQMNVEAVYRTAADAPQELEAAANDAQYITDYMTGLVNSREIRQGARQERYLQVGDKIEYNEKQYEVIGNMRGRELQMEDKSTGNRFKVSPGDGIYSSLLAARNEAMKTEREQAQLAAQEQVMGPEAELDNSMQHEHANEEEMEHFLSPGDEEEDFSLELNQEEGENQKTGRKR